MVPDVRRLVRQVDGLSHVVLGPLLLLVSEPVADALSVPVDWLRPFLVVFIAYGVVVLFATRSGPRLGPRSTALVMTANVGFLVAVSLSLATSTPSAVGVAAHVAAVAGAAAMITLLGLHVLRPSARRSPRGSPG